MVRGRKDKCTYVITRQNLESTYLEHEIHVRGHRRAVLQPRLGELAHQFVDGRHDARHLVATYLPVAVQIVQRERPPELVVHRSSGQRPQALHHVLRKQTNLLRVEIPFSAS